MKKLCLISAATMIVVAPAFAADENTLTIGMTLSQTGSLNVDSVAQQRGADMWRDEVNAAGGIKVGNQRYKVRFVTYDDHGQAYRYRGLPFFNFLKSTWSKSCWPTGNSVAL